MTATQKTTRGCVQGTEHSVAPCVKGRVAKGLMNLREGKKLVTPTFPSCSYSYSGNQEFPLRYAACLSSAGHAERAHGELNRAVRSLNHAWFHAEGGCVVPKIPRPRRGADGGYESAACAGGGGVRQNSPCSLCRLPAAPCGTREFRCQFTVRCVNR